MSPLMVKAWLDTMIMMEGGVHRGFWQIQMFIMMHPMTHSGEHVKIYRRIRDTEAVERFTRFYDWYLYPVDMSGALFKWCLPHLFLDNELYRGTLTIGGRPVRLGSITAPVFMLAGSDDDITPPAQQMNMANVIGSERIRQIIVPGGHIGLFIGRRSQEGYWPEVLHAVRELSEPARRS